MFRMAFALKKMNTLELFMFSNYIQSQKDEYFIIIHGFNQHATARSISQWSSSLLRFGPTLH